MTMIILPKCKRFCGQVFHPNLTLLSSCGDNYIESALIFQEINKIDETVCQKLVKKGQSCKISSTYSNLHFNKIANLLILQVLMPYLSCIKYIFNVNISIITYIFNFNFSIV